MPCMTIIDVADILNTAQVRDKEWTALRLADYVHDTENCLSWCSQRRLVKNSVLCSRCNRATSLHSYKAAKMANFGNATQVKLFVAYKKDRSSKEVM